VGAEYQSLGTPSAICVDDSGNIYIADTENHRVSKWSAAGNALGWIGGGNDGWNTSSGSVDYDSWENKRFDNPYGITIDDKFIYIVERGNSRVSKWGLDGAYLGWIGKGSDDWRVTLDSDRSGSNDYRSFDNPIGICMDGSKNLFVADSANHRISKWHQGD
jgi:sugar lactone lactonase YvrE